MRRVPLKQPNLFRNIFLFAVMFFVIQANAAVVMNGGNNIGAGYRQSVNQELYSYKKLDNAENQKNSLIKQPKIAEPAIAGINSGDSNDSNSSVVYVLKKHIKNQLGGSPHQNQMLKQYLGKNY